VTLLVHPAEVCQHFWHETASSCLSCPSCNFVNGAAAMAGVIALAMWVEHQATRQWILRELCGNGIHSYGHGDKCVECGQPDSPV